MKMKTVMRVISILIAGFSLSTFFGCAGYEYNTRQKEYPYAYIHKELPEADRAIEKARREGKDRQCPEEFKAAEELRDKAYSDYAACLTKQGIAQAKDATARANALCPPQAAAPPAAPPAAVPEPGIVKYCITINIVFDIDKAEVRREFHDEVGRVGTFMRKFPTTTAVIEGHTDDVGTDEHNMELSQKRAENVVNYLVDNFGIDRSRLAAKGYGKTRPITDDRTAEGMQKNRRIEAIIDCAMDIEGLEPVPDKLCLTLKIEFDTDKADIKPEYHGEIEEVADFMKKNPTVTSVVEGHTDDVGTPEYNMKLSQKRAESVVNYLVEKFGIDRSRLSAKGYGQTRRIAYNTTPEGRQKNRRINMIIDCVLKK